MMIKLVYDAPDHYTVYTLNYFPIAKVMLVEEESEITENATKKPLKKSV